MKEKRKEEGEVKEWKDERRDKLNKGGNDGKERERTRTG